MDAAAPSPASYMYVIKARDVHLPARSNCNSKRPAQLTGFPLPRFFPSTVRTVWGLCHCFSPSTSTPGSLPRFRHSKHCPSGRCATDRQRHRSWYLRVYVEQFNQSFEGSHRCAPHPSRVCVSGSREVVHAAIGLSLFDAKKYSCTAEAADLSSNATGIPSFRRVRLFRVRKTRGGPDRPCIHTTLTLWTGESKTSRVQGTPRHITYPPFTILATTRRPCESIAPLSGNLNRPFLFEMP